MTPQNSRNPAASEGALAPTPLPQKLVNLQEEREWLLKQIRRKRTELDNFINQMRDLASEVFQRGAEGMNRLQEIDAEIHAMFDEIFAKRKMGKQTRRQVENIYRSLQMQGVISFKPLESDEEFDPFFSFFDDDEPMSSGPGEYSAGGPSAESVSESEPSGDAANRDRAFRQTFLRLASIYHPDRAEDETTQAQNTEIMKETNRAYKSGDFARLLELEQQQLGREQTDEIDFAGDDLERECQRLAKQNESLRDQYEGIKAELRKLRNETQEGMLVKTHRKAAKQGIDFVGEMVAEADEEMEYLEYIRDFVRDFRDRKITLKEFLAGPSRTSEEDLIAAMEELFGIRIVKPDMY